MIRAHDGCLRRTFTAAALILIGVCHAQALPKSGPVPAPQSERPAAQRQTIAAQTTLPLTYSLEADVSMRSIPVDVRFSGARLVIFGAVNRTGVAPSDAGPLEIVAVVQGARSSLVVRRKSNIGGLWLNTKRVEFEQAPQYYAVASTRPLEAIASQPVLAENGIGFEQVPISTALGEAAGLKPTLLNDFRDAAIALGIKQKRYARQDGGIVFVGSSLFRGQLDLPASIPVGPLDVSFFLFRGGHLVARHEASVNLSRQGIEHFIYEQAQHNALLYGIFTVALAGAIGLVSSSIVSARRR